MMIFTCEAGVRELRFETKPEPNLDIGSINQFEIFLVRNHWSSTKT